MIKIAVVGYGYWGPNLARNVSDIPGAELAYVCDANPKSLEKARSRHPGACCTTDYAEVLHDREVDAVFIATPVSTHVDLALRAVRAGKHVLVEKPLAFSTADAKSVIEEARRQSRVLCVDHTFVFMGAVSKVRDLIRDDSLGELYYYDSVRINLGLFQHDVNVAWDLAVHDLSILDYWVSKKPVAVSCLGSAHIPGRPMDVAYLTLKYENSFMAHLHVNWLSPIKIRKTLLAGSRKMVVMDDLEVTEKIKIYDRGVADADSLVGAQGTPLAYRRTGDILIPQFDTSEALRLEIEHFLRCINQGETPRAGGEAGLRVVQILEAAEKSIEDNGQLVRIAD